MDTGMPARIRWSHISRRGEGSGMAAHTQTQVGGGQLLGAPQTRAPKRAELSFGLGALEQVGGMVMLAVRALVCLVTPPFTWRAELVDQTWITVRRCLLPVAISNIVFGFGAPGMTGGQIVNIFGTMDRTGAFFVMASVREFAPWINAMLVAGVAGTAIAADLGARKVREELDALAVLGLDATRELVAPRLLALVVLTPLFCLIAAVCGVIGGGIATVVVFQDTTAGFLSTFYSNFTMPDLIGSLTKSVIFGFLIAIFCCYKGLNVKGGPQGVGRAVNQAVVLSFVGVFVVNYLFTSTLLASFPETSDLH
jgi:phospholipid/cholesterol/gamma-HCH transport system permease protein